MWLHHGGGVAVELMANPQPKSPKQPPIKVATTMREEQGQGKGEVKRGLRVTTKASPWGSTTITIDLGFTTT